MPLTHKIRLYLFVLPVNVLLGAPLQGQALEPGAAAGVAIPAGGLDVGQDAGPTIRLSVGLPLTQALGLRVDGEWTRFAGVDPERNRADLQILSLILNGTIEPWKGAAVPYGLMGFGLYHPRIAEDINDPPIAGILQAGLGLQVGIRDRLTGFVEGRAILGLSDYGVGDKEPYMARSVTVGVRLGR